MLAAGAGKRIGRRHAEQPPSPRPTTAVAAGREPQRAPDEAKKKHAGRVKGGGVQHLVSVFVSSAGLGGRACR
jgi:hypothetical protein